jgi:hypothetical protein
MPFRHACFISYRHLKEALGQKFIDQFSRALSSEIELYFTEERIFIDRDDLEPGAEIDPAIASELCASVCMVLVYIPSYVSKTRLYCAVEYKAMETIERLRRERSGKRDGFIIPVVLRKEPAGTLPSFVKRRKFFDFSRFSVLSDFSSLPDFHSQVQQIVMQMRKLYKQYNHLLPDDHCNDFLLPDSAEVLNWIDEMESEDHQPFPGR